MFFTRTTLLLLICNLYFSSGFNYDTNFPLVYTNPLRDHPSSYFGFSVIISGNSTPPWIQIGVPKAKNYNLRNIESGGVFRCDIYGPCNFIDVDPFPITSGVHFKEKKDGAWIGGTMDINEILGRVVVCGHRWINNKLDDYWMQGACYWSNTNDTMSSKLLPLADNAKAIIHDRATKINVFYYGQGQAGFSAHLVKEQNHTELVLGAPGVYNWDGTTLIYKDAPDFSPLPSKLTGQRRGVVKRTASYAKFSDLNIGNAISTTQTAAFGLFGYSITSGCFFKKHELLYVSGAPRSKNYVGQILIYNFANKVDQALEVKDSRQGYQFGEYFGAALAAGDINSDGLDDLIIGAPFYAGRKYNEGRIFVFLGSAKGTLVAPDENPIIEGNAIGGQFGLTLMFLGDIDFDTFGDIAVGAPYEDEGSGVVYIFRGNSLGIHSKPSQRIVGKSIVANVLGFGISLSNPSDVDDNKYKDLAVGAYKSGHVVLLRSRPVVTLQHSIVSLTPRLDYNAKAFSVKTCFWFTGFALPDRIDVIRKINVDEVLHRARLSNINATETITLYKDDVICQNINISIKSDISNRYDPITFSVSQELIEPTDSRVLYVNQVNSSKIDDKFCKECPTTNKYTSSKEKMIELTFALGCGKDNICTSKLNLETSFIGLNDEFILGSSDYVNLKTTITNAGEKAYLTQLMVELPRSIYFRSIPTYCLEQNSSSVIVCNVENPLEENKQKSFVLDLDMKGLSNTKNNDVLNFTFVVFSSSINMNNNIFFKTLKIAREADMVITGKASQQSYSYGNVTDGRPNFTQIYQVEKIGASPIDEVLLTIHIPTQIYGLKPITFMKLYMPEGYHAGQPINCRSNVQYIIEDDLDNVVNQFNQKDANEITSEGSLLKRSVPRQSDQTLILNNTNKETEFPSNRTFYINCSNSDVACSTVSCSIGPFKNKQNTAVIQIKMLLDVSSLSDVLDNKDVIIISTDGLITIVTPPNFIQNGDRSDFARVSSVFIGEVLESKVDLWIIIVSIAIGLLVLLVLILGLIKAGFFQRKKKQELQALKEAEEVEQFKRDSAHCYDEDAEECDGKQDCDS